MKELPAYKEGRYSEALEEAFLSFDATLVKDDVLAQLKEIAQVDEDDEEQEGEKVSRIFYHTIKNIGPNKFFL